MTLKEKVKNTPIGKRPLINDTPGKPAHPMTDEQYAEYLKMQEEMWQMPAPDPSPEERLQKLEDENKELKAMIRKLSEV